MNFLLTHSSQALIFFIFFLTLILKRKVEIGLDTVQIHHLEDEFHEIPEEFRETITLTHYQQSQAYNIKKLKTKKAFGIFSLIFLLLWTVGSGLNILYQFLEKAFHFIPSLSLDYFYLLSFLFINFLLSLPYKYYSVFSVEEAFGFNKMTKKAFFFDEAKTLIIEGILLTPLILILLYFIQSSLFWPFYAFSFIMLFMAFLHFIAPLLLPLFFKFQEVTDASLLEKLTLLFSKEGLTFKTPLVMLTSQKTKHSNAFFYGLSKTKNIVFYDNLLSLLSPNETQAVLMHELAHLKFKHNLKLLAAQAFLLFLCFFILSFLFTWTPFYLGHGVYVIGSGTFIALLMALFPTYSFFLTPFFRYLQRKYELEADLFVKEKGMGEDLKSALLKLNTDNLSILSPHPSFVRYYYSHPPLSERLRNLK